MGTDLVSAFLTTVVALKANPNDPYLCTGVFIAQQECIPVGMRTARSSSRPGGISTRHPPGTSPPPPPPGADLPPGPATPPPVNRMTDRCKNTTLPQTSFTGGKNWNTVKGEIKLIISYLEIIYECKTELGLFNPQSAACCHICFTKELCALCLFLPENWLRNGHVFLSLDFPFVTKKWEVRPNTFL